MKTIKTAGKDLITIEVPGDAYDFKLTQYKQHTVLNYTYKINGNIANVAINDGEFNVILNNAKILGKLSELSEEECSRFVANWRIDGLYQNYKIISQYEEYMFKTARESLISLLQSNGVDTSKTILIIERI